MEEFNEEIVNDEGAMDRRRFLKKAAVTSMWATPVIMTLASGSAAASHRSSRLGQPCTPHPSGPYARMGGRRAGHERFCTGEGSPNATLQCRPTRRGFRCVRV